MSALRPVDVLQRHGARGVAHILSDRVKLLAESEHAHVWSAIDLSALPPEPRGLPEGSVLRRARSDEHLPEVFHAVSPKVTERRRRLGGTQWVLEVDGRPAFTCWLLLQESAWIGSAGGRYGFGPEIVSLEDSVTHPDFRGRGLAPAVWDRLARDRAAEGFSWMVTCVEVHNVPSRKAVAKAGFVEFLQASVHFHLGRRQVVTEAVGAGTAELAPIARSLASSLSGS